MLQDPCNFQESVGETFDTNNSSLFQWKFQQFHHYFMQAKSSFASTVLINTILLSTYDIF